jgi:hypothetical protein
MKHVSVSPRRPRSNSAERAQWAQRFYESGLSQREFALRHQLRLSTLQRWLAQNPPASSPPAFAEVKLAGLPPRWAAEVVRADGTVLRLAHDAPSALLELFFCSC